jgi:hypothetical protein
MNENVKDLKSYLSQLSVPEDDEMVLVALYFVHSKMGRETIAASDLNEMLGQAGLAFKDIHRILHRLKEQSPSMAEEVSQSGDFPPEDVLYSITEDGASRAKEIVEK